MARGRLPEKESRKGKSSKNTHTAEPSNTENKNRKKTRSSPTIPKRRRSTLPTTEVSQKPVKSRAKRYEECVKNALKRPKEVLNKQTVSDETKKRCRALGIRLTKGNKERKRKTEALLISECAQKDDQLKKAIRKKSGSRRHSMSTPDEEHVLEKKKNSRQRKKSSSRSNPKKSRSKGNAWTSSISEARQTLGVFGFQALTKESELYKLAKQIHEKKKSAE